MKFAEYLITHKNKGRGTQMKKMLLALSLSGALLGGSVAWAEEAAIATTPSSDVAVTTVETSPIETTNATEVAAVAEVSTPEAAEPEAVLDTGDTAWILVSTALVLLMTIPGLALFYGGMVRKKNVLNTMAYSFVAAAVVSIAWVAVGYSLAFGEGNAFIGGLDKVMLAGIGTDALSGSIPEILFVIFPNDLCHHYCGHYQWFNCRKNEVWCLCCLYRDLGGRGLCTNYPLGMGWWLVRQ